MISNGESVTKISNYSVAGQWTTLLTIVTEKEDAHLDNKKEKIDANNAIPDIEKENVNMNTKILYNQNANVNMNTYEIRTDTIIDNSDDSSEVSGEEK